MLRGLHCTAILVPKIKERDLAPFEGKPEISTNLKTAHCGEQAVSLPSNRSRHSDGRLNRSWLRSRRHGARCAATRARAFPMPQILARGPFRYSRKRSSRWTSLMQLSRDRRIKCTRRSRPRANSVQRRFNCRGRLRARIRRRLRPSSPLLLPSADMQRRSKRSARLRHS